MTATLEDTVPLALVGASAFSTRDASKRCNNLGRDKAPHVGGEESQWNSERQANMGRPPPAARAEFSPGPESGERFRHRVSVTKMRKEKSRSIEPQK
jgi:hypothetical protein